MFSPRPQHAAAVSKGDSERGLHLKAKLCFHLDRLNTALILFQSDLLSVSPVSQHRAQQWQESLLQVMQMYFRECNFLEDKKKCWWIILCSVITFASNESVVDIKKERRVFVGWGSRIIEQKHNCNCNLGETSSYFLKRIFSGFSTVSSSHADVNANQ